MRPLEIVLPLVLAAALLWPLPRTRHPEIFGLLPTFALLVAITHARVEGMRWQMYPLYTITLILFLMSLPDYLRVTRKADSDKTTQPALIGRLAALLLIAAATALPTLLPVPTLPAPGGNYAIATQTFELTDTSREEIYVNIPGLPRRLMVQVWYPASPPPLETPHAPWMAEAAANAPTLANYFHFPSFFLNHLTLAVSQSYESLPIHPGGPYPVLIFAHGWNGFRQQSTYQMEALASHGYIVIAPDFPYGAMMVRFPNGDVAYNNPAALPNDAPNDQAYEAAARRLVAQWSQDINFLLNHFSAENANPQSPFYQALDLEKVGVFGHSTGGGATIQFCASDPRCKAGFTEDAFMRPVGLDILKNGTPQPFFYLFSEAWPFARNIELFDQYYNHAAPNSPIAILLGTKHLDFTDLPGFTPIAYQMGLKGPLNGARVEEVINAYLVAFFDQALKGVHSPLLDGPNPQFPELKWQAPKKAQ